MKRLLAVALATVLLACLLSLSVSADEADIMPLADSSAWSSYQVSQLLKDVQNIQGILGYTTISNQSLQESLLQIKTSAATSATASSNIFKVLGYGTGIGGGSLHGDLNYLYTALLDIVNNTSSSGGLGSLVQLLNLTQDIKNYTGSMSTDVVDIAEDVDTIRSDTRTIMDYVEGSLDNFLASIDQHVGFVDRYTTELYLAYVSDDHDVVRGDGSELTAQLPTLFGLQFETVDSLPYILRGGKDSTLKNTIYDSQTANDDGSLASTDWEANNILSAFSVLFPIQHDVARLTNVLATGPKIQLEKSQEENIQAVTDNFTGDKGVQSSQIGDMSGIGDSLGSVADTGVSVGDGFAQVGNSWNFFSAEVAATLDTAPALTAEEEDNYISFFDSNNSDFDALLSNLRGE